MAGGLGEVQQWVALVPVQTTQARGSSLTLKLG